MRVAVAFDHRGVMLREAVLEKLGFTPDAVVERALALRTRVS